ncbi:Hint domain-containing protein [Sphingomonas sp. H39-1-10]|uniref:Hint domain-containing protein n=1 Tax=Sphingomonas pollutisoli TaxID=3030829 RepID=UPI0023B9D548|nr:Hint domain-containing protein [Sphingomonas pollutisoli]MDF0491402.1 Hint domain-containing protein [Sphingomonas pollutisoli]
MADNPFDIDSLLNGVNFPEDQLRAVDFFNTDPESGGVNGGSAAMVGAFRTGAWLGEPTVPLNPGEITVLSNAYVAGHTEYSTDYYGNSRAWYYLPTFGSIQFSDYVDADGNPYTLYIHGFAENGLLLSQNDNLVYNDRGGLSAGHPATTGGENPRALVLGTNGIEPDAADITFDKDPSVFCFAEGTRIATASGLVAVETLAIGDLALTASGEARPVKWIGQLVARPSRHRRPHEVNPVRVTADAFGPGLPERDVRLSPGHAVYVDGVLVPVGHLVNGATIVQEAVEQIRYFHIELDSHDVLLAEGLPCESYLDDGNRRSFANGGESVELHGRLDPKSWDDACAPLVAGGPQLVAIRETLHARAEELGWTRTEDADLVFEADGVSILPVRIDGNRYRFVLPAASTLVLKSNSAVLAHVMPALGDGRLLGVAVADLHIDGEPVDLDAALFGKGFLAVERHEGIGWRWTNGAGVLALDAVGPTTLDLTLAMVAPSWKRAQPILRIAA